jgi:hypothetical protein
MATVSPGCGGGAESRSARIDHRVNRGHGPQLGSVNAVAAELGATWPSLRKAFARHGLGMPACNRGAVRQWAVVAAGSRPPRSRLENHFLRQLCAVSIDSEGSLSMPWRRLTRTTRLA